MNDRRKDKLKRQRELQWRRSQLRLPPRDPVIGYVARQGIHMACDGDACIVAGSRAAMVAILEYHRSDPAEHAIEPAHCSQILQAIGLGGAYAFDEQAYGRFLPEAQQVGLPLVEEGFGKRCQEPKHANRFLTPYLHRSHQHRVARGGSWRDRPLRARSSMRLSYRPYQRVYNVGFRVVAAPSSP